MFREIPGAVSSSLSTALTHVLATIIRGNPYVLTSPQTLRAEIFFSRANFTVNWRSWCSKMSVCLIHTSLSHTLKDKLYDHRRQGEALRVLSIDLHSFRSLCNSEHLHTRIFTHDFSDPVSPQQQSIATLPKLVLAAAYAPRNSQFHSENNKFAQFQT